MADMAAPSEAIKQHLHADAPLHRFEHDVKLFVVFGLFFFSFANAGVEASTVGALTWSILVAL
eukprot:4736733-Prorocentrum_lima.AAC.1